jgi:hypothetical protein
MKTAELFEQLISVSQHYVTFVAAGLGIWLQSGTGVAVSFGLPVCGAVVKGVACAYLDRARP